MRKNWSRIALVVGVLVVGAGLVGWLRVNSDDPRPEPPDRLQAGTLPDPDAEASEKGEKIDLLPLFDDDSVKDGDKTMRFGLIVTAVKDASSPTGYKQLSWHPHGLTSNACLKIDGEQYLFGHAPGTWTTMAAELGPDKDGMQRVGRKSVWRVGPKDSAPLLQVTQVAETVRGPLTGKLDTCRVTYRLKNLDEKPHRVGLRYMLDTLVGANDGAPFVVPGREWLCEKQMQFNSPSEVPPFVFALEEMKLNSPGIVAQVGVKLPAPVEPPARLTLGAWPNEKKVKGAKGGLTLWDVKVIPLDVLQDSAAVLYWPEGELPAGGSRLVGFTYGLGRFGASKDGAVGFFVAGDPRVGGELVVTALVRDAEFGQKVTLKPAAGFDFVGCKAEQSIGYPPPGEYPFSPVSWTVRPTQAGSLKLRVESTDASHEESLEIRGA